MEEKEELFVRVESQLINAEGMTERENFTKRTCRRQNH